MTSGNRTRIFNFPLHFLGIYKYNHYKLIHNVSRMDMHDTHIYLVNQLKNWWCCLLELISTR